MSDKIRGTIAIVVGLFALFQGTELYRAGQRDWHLWVELVAGVGLILLGVWRIKRKPYVAM
jgi:hypothetical protein